MTDGEAFEEPVEQARCPNCLSAVEPDQQYCLQCGERLAPSGPPPSSPLRGRSRPPAAIIVAIGALLLLLGGFGIAYGFTRDDDGTKAAGTTTGKSGSSTGGVVVPTLTITDTNQSVPTFTEVVPTGTDITTGTIPTDTIPTFPTDTGTTDPGTGTGTTATDPGDEANDWPEGEDAYAVILSSDDTEQYTFDSITAKKQQAVAKGFSNAGVLNSDDYFTLNPGYWVLYLGPYDTKAEAQAAQAEARAAGYSDAYVRRVAE